MLKIIVFFLIFTLNLFFSLRLLIFTLFALIQEFLIDFTIYGVFCIAVNF